jgi:hypothetical protein
MGGHDFVTARSEKFIDDALKKLIPLVGEDEAMQTLCVMYVDVDNQQRTETSSGSPPERQSERQLERQ